MTWLLLCGGGFVLGVIVGAIGALCYDAWQIGKALWR